MSGGVHDSPSSHSAPCLPRPRKERADLLHRRSECARLETYPLHGRVVHAGPGPQVDGEAPRRIDQELATSRVDLVDVRILRELPDHYSAADDVVERATQACGDLVELCPRDDQRWRDLQAAAGERPGQNPVTASTECDAIGQAGVVGQEGLVDLDRGDGAEAGADLGDEVVSGERGERSRNL